MLPMEKKSSLLDSANGDDANASADDENNDSFISGNSGFGTDRDIDGEGMGEGEGTSKHNHSKDGGQNTGVIQVGKNFKILKHSLSKVQEGEEQQTFAKKMD